MGSTNLADIFTKVLASERRNKALLEYMHTLERHPRFIGCRMGAPVTPPGQSMYCGFILPGLCGWCYQVQV
jgi:hypothetical protein